jgi:hypothetical protein
MPKADVQSVIRDESNPWNDRDVVSVPLVLDDLQISSKKGDLINLYKCPLCAKSGYSFSYLYNLNKQ